MRTIGILANALFIMVGAGVVAAAPLEDLNKQLTSLVKAAGPSVVEVTIEVRTPGTVPSREDSEPVTATRTVVSRGTGFVISADGYILTRATIFSSAQRLRVTFTDGTTSTGRVIGYDKVVDLAVVKVDREDLKALELGDSDTLEPGSPVVMINNQAGLANSVSLGIVAGTGRRIGGDLPDLIQISGTIGPGASGGPVLDASGKVVAMTIAILSPSETPTQTSLQTELYAQYLKDWRKTKDTEVEVAVLSKTFHDSHPNLVAKKTELQAAREKLDEEWTEIQRLLDLAKPPTARTSSSSGFAVPVNTLKPSIELLKNGQRIRRAWLGASVTLKDGQMVLKPVSGGPAEQSGIKAGDVLMSVDRTHFDSPYDVLRYIFTKKPGDAVRLTLRRENKEIELSVKLGEEPTELRDAPPGNSAFARIPIVLISSTFL